MITGNIEAEKAQTKIIILLGAPASGKGTQAKTITKELGILHISTGDILRENIKNDTTLGKEAKVYMEQGKLVPDALVLDMLFERISRADAKKGYLLDGFPRTVAQAEAYDAKLGQVKYTVIDIEVPEEILLERIAGRAQKEGRADDTQEIAKERLNVYNTQTKPLIDYYEDKGVLFKVDGNKSVDEVRSSIMNIIETAHSCLCCN